MSYRFLLVDDDRTNLNSIAETILELLPDVHVEKANNGIQAIGLLGQEHYDMLFLAVGMEGLDSFRLLESVPNRNFELVFMSEDPEAAFDAIKEGATDYLLKPIRKAALRETLQKVVEKRSRYLAYSKVPPDPNAYLLQKISIPHQQGLWFVTLQDIVYMKADNTYTTIYTTSGEKITTSKPISRFEQALDTPWFFRIHKSFLINTSQFNAYISKGRDLAVMSNGDKLLISRYRLSNFLDVMKEITGDVKV